MRSKVYLSLLSKPPESRRVPSEAEGYKRVAVPKPPLWKRLLGKLPLIGYRFRPRLTVQGWALYDAAEGGELLYSSQNFPEQPWRL